MSTPLPFEREVAGVEKAFVAQNELRPPFVIQMVLEAASDPEPEVLHEALERTTDANPGSALVLEERGDNLRWVLGAPPTLTVLDAELEGALEEAPFFGWPLDCAKGPSAELLSVRGKSHRYLIFRAAHAVMDGQGTLRWVKDFMRCLRGEAPLGHPSTLTIDQLLRGRSPVRRPMPEPDALHPFGRPSAESAGRFLWRRVSSDRPLDATILGRIGISLAERARQGGDEGPVRINLPTDLRHYAEDQRSTANLFNTLFLEVLPEASPEGLGLKVIRMLYQHEGTKPFGIYGGDEPASLALQRVKLLWDLAQLHDREHYTYSATLSHLGALKRAELAAPGIFETESAFFVPMYGDAGPVLTVNGFEARTEVCAGLPDRFATEGRLEELVALVARAIG